MPVTLYKYKDANISIDIEARFDKGDLVIDGYDIGKTVEEAWGDSDYEYVLTVKAQHVQHVCEKLDLPMSDPEQWLKALAGRFRGNYCFSEFEKFLTDHQIPHSRFTWA